ncbi:MAG: TrbC/VirB2 family protein [Sphingomonas sp.]|nr:TrbC/VirB2 family protein [Sphingomonas sp.]
MMAEHAIPAAAHWLQSTMLGTIATTLAVVCVAAVGLGMLNGRMDARRGITVIAGCFLVFGSTSIAAGLRSLTEFSDGGPELIAAQASPMPIQAIFPPPQLPPPPPQVRDPYAGAALHY